MGDIFEKIIPQDEPDNEEKDYGTFNTDTVSKENEDIKQEPPEEPEKEETELEEEEKKEVETEESEEEKEEKEIKKEEEELPKWMYQLPRSMRMQQDIVDELKDFKTIKELVEDYLDVLDRLDESVVIPGEDASEEEIKEFLERMGVPEDPSEYEIEPWKTPDGEEIDVTIREPLIEAMHKVRLSKTQAKRLYEEMGRIFLKKVEIEQEEIEENARANEEYFRIKWGQNYDKNMSAIIDTIHKLGSPDLIEAIDKSGLGNNRDFINFMYNVSKNFAEDQFVSGEPAVTEEEIPRMLSYPSMENMQKE